MEGEGSAIFPGIAPKNNQISPKVELTKPTEGNGAHHRADTGGSSVRVSNVPRLCENSIEGIIILSN